MGKIKEIIKGVSDGLKKAAPKCLFDSDREAYEWVYSELVRVIHLLGGKEWGEYRQDTYRMMTETHGFLFTHNVAHRNAVDEGNANGGVVIDLDFGLGRDINGRVFILFDYGFTPEGEHFLVRERMYNQRCLSMLDVKFMREAEDGVFYFLTRIIDEIYQKRHEYHNNESFWDDADLEYEWVDLPKSEWYYDHNKNMMHTFEWRLTVRKSWFDEYYKDKEERNVQAKESNQ